MFAKYTTIIIAALFFGQSLFAACDLMPRLNYKTNGLEVVFANTTTTTYSSLVWNFGDGTTSTQANPTHRYTQAGEHNFTLTVTTLQGCEATIEGKVFVFAPKAKTVAAPAGVTQVSSYPNPFTNEAQLSFYSPVASTATITVADLSGKTVATVISNEAIAAGNNQVTIQRNNLAAGIYVVSIVSNNQVATQKISIMN